MWGDSMKNILKISALASAMIAFVPCFGMMTVYDKGATFDRHGKMLPELRGKVYDNLDLRTQDSYLCTSKQHNTEGTERWKHNFVSAYKLQDPSFARSITIKPLKFLTRDYCGLGVVGVIDPASKNFYSHNVWEDYQNGTNNPAPLLNYRAPTGFALNVRHFSPDEYIADEHVGGKGGLSRMTLFAAMGHVDQLKADIDSTMNPDSASYRRSLCQVVDVAMHQKQLPALSLAVRAKGDILEKLQSEDEKRRFLRSDVCSFKENIQRALKNKDLDVFRVLIQDAPYDIMIQRIPFCATCDTHDTLRDVILNAKAQGLCTQQEITFFDAVKNEKYKSLNPNKRSEDQHCTIL